MEAATSNGVSEKTTYAKLFPVCDDRLHAVAQDWISAAQDDGIDEREDNDAEANPGEEMKRFWPNTNTDDTRDKVVLSQF